MSSLELFPKQRTVGIFRGFIEGGLEFKADLVLPYKNDFQTIPMYGQFLLVQLENHDEAVLGRITSMSSEGKLSYGSGEEFNIRAIQENREIPDDLRRQYLRYKINIRVLGVVRQKNNKIEFAPSHRRMPHVGSPVSFPSEELLMEILGHNNGTNTIGHYALGEFIYSGSNSNVEIENWMQIKYPEIKINFDILSLASRRSFIFARAGFGKSNLNKLLFSRLYLNKEPPYIEKYNKKVPVGTIIFDPDGEYFWPDDKGRAGLCDVPELEEKLVVFTDRSAPSKFYQSFVAGGIKLDIRNLKPADVISIALQIDKQDQQNVRKLKGLSYEKWNFLVNLIDEEGNSSDLDKIKVTLELSENQDAEAMAARSNMTHIVKTLHDKSSQLMDKLLYALSHGKLCIIDFSRMRGNQALILSGLILRRIFEKNQDEFTNANPNTIPTIAVVEEAQSVLNEKSGGVLPYIEWVKEGRKYDLGSLLITQQPGSIPIEILSQGDNWFIFHLLSASDLNTLKAANAHFSQDLLSSLLNEPIPGQGIFWSSVNGKPFPISMRIISFNKLYKPLDKNYTKDEANTFAKKIVYEFKHSVQIQNSSNSALYPEKNFKKETENESEVKLDVFKNIEEHVVNNMKENIDFIKMLESEEGIPWGRVKAMIFDLLSDKLDDRGQRAYNLVVPVMKNIYGEQNKAWYQYKNNQNTSYIRKGEKV